MSARSSTISPSTTRFIYTEPWGGEIPMWRQNDLMYEYACHEANYGMFNILRGARYQERQTAESDGQEP